MSNAKPLRTDRDVVEVMDDAMAEVLRGKSEAERLAIAHGMWRSARDMPRVLVRTENPEASSEAVDLEVARRLASGAALDQSTASAE